MGRKMTLSLKFLIAAILCLLFAVLFGYTLRMIETFHRFSFMEVIIFGTIEIFMLKIAPIALLLIGLVMKVLKK
ncbi:hypothetical protein D6856_02675 [Butyrivibrio sp. XB500-5]|uniref:hypothetical protein n=1 Tax=Butyrivibrio sp. XB500-5 TaxID=2364880 RepID=UPI000EAAC392|nr:hypothetical protein [Butyrivibrio sp. XB500-5]RKM63042.1 hypothetical protein D6856_02675 [Butyrivibrio sp. XB500-5]